MIDRISAIVKAARERTTYSRESLAERSGVPLDVLLRLESGLPGITTTQLDNVAEALSLDPVALLKGESVQRPLPSVFLRHAPIQDFDHDRDASVLDDALEQGRTLARLATLLQEPPAATQSRAFAPREAAADRADAPAQDGYRLARELRSWLGNPVDPIGDIRELAEVRLGVAVLLRTQLSSKLTAAGVRADTSAAVVLAERDLLRAKNPLLARVYLAHEFCHLLFDPAPGGLQVVIDQFVDRKIQAAEQRARAFAAEFLLPYDGLVRLLGSPRGVSTAPSSLDLVERARGRFGTPHEITANHLCNLGFIDRGTREWLEAAKTTFTGTPPETTLPRPNHPSVQVAAYVQRAHRDGILMDGEARTILGIDRLSPLPWDEIEL